MSVTMSIPSLAAFDDLPIKEDKKNALDATRTNSILRVPEFAFIKEDERFVSRVIDYLPFFDCVGPHMSEDEALIKSGTELKKYVQEMADDLGHHVEVKTGYGRYMEFQKSEANQYITYSDAPEKKMQLIVEFPVVDLEGGNLVIDGIAQVPPGKGKMTLHLTYDESYYDIAPITSGKRAILVYDVFHAVGLISLTKSPQVYFDMVEKGITKLKGQGVSQVGFILNHCYSTWARDLSIDDLKGADLAGALAFLRFTKQHFFEEITYADGQAYFNAINYLSKAINGNIDDHSKFTVSWDVITDYKDIKLPKRTWNDRALDEKYLIGRTVIIDTNNKHSGDIYDDIVIMFKL